jgi:predicted lipid-binding transport protein (Tim44 family)
MPTRKQRRRRDKDFRHDVRVFEVDEQGNEVPLAELRAKDEPKEKAKAATAKSAPAKGSRPLREPPQPSWERALRRGGMMGGAMLLAFIFLFKSGPVAVRIVWGLFYAVAFIPLTYWIDRTAYRSYQKRVARRSAPKAKKAA